MSRLTDRAAGLLRVTAAAILWGSAGVAVKFIFGATDIDPPTLAQFRLTVSFLLLGIFLALFRPHLIGLRRADLPAAALYGTVGLWLTQVAYYVAIHESDVAVAVFIQYLAPLLTAAYEIAVLRRRPGKATFAVMALATGGSLLLLLGRTGGGMASTPLGLVAAVVSTFGFAFYALSGSRAMKTLDPWTFLLWGMGAGVLLWTVIRPPWVVLAVPLSGREWAFIFYLSVLATILPFGLFLAGLRHIGATTAAVTATVEPVWAAALAWLALGENLSLTQIGGCVLILGAVIALRMVPGTAIEDRPRPETGDDP